MNFARKAYEPVGIRLEFDPRLDGPDWEVVRSTLLNLMTGTSDGDQLASTPPDPYIDTPAFQCAPPEYLDLAGRRLRVPRENPMGYWFFEEKRFTEEQGEVMRSTIDVRFRPGVVEAEELPIAEAPRSGTLVQDMHPWGLDAISLVPVSER